MNRWILCALLLFFACPLAVAAQSEQEAKDLAAIRAAVDSYVAAYNRGDAKGVAGHWSESADWIGPSGERFQGRQTIEREMEAMFAENRGLKIEVVEPTVRLVAPDAAVEEGTVRVLRPGEPAGESTYIAVHAKKNGQWKLESVRETSLPETSAREQLKQLEWLVGEWIDESASEVVEHRCRWSEDGHYLLGTFVVQWEGLPAMKGDVRIGWDPLTKQIKSWIFDTEGGRAEGVWTRDGDRWIVKMTGVRPDGSTASATNTYVPLRRDQYQYSSTDRIVGGQPEPGQTVLIVRKPPQPKNQ
ncbi:MAG: SgcJ/EcaC family oxidoreductase [Pirellulales bacterium]|nr:SgcJ/EcaC family oxidoreductase [Pirellulales bacterium]